MLRCYQWAEGDIVRYRCIKYYYGDFLVAFSKLVPLLDYNPILVSIFVVILEQPFLSPPTTALYFVVLSLDGWGRFRTEGYGHYPVPHRPGRYTTTVSTWRPTGSILDKLKRYFIGGSPELTDTTYTGIPSTLQVINHHILYFGYEPCCSL